MPIISVIVPVYNAEKFLADYLTYSFRNMGIKRKASVYLSVCECYYEIKIKE